MSINTLKCDYCGDENRRVPIIQKPTRFGFKGKIRHLEQVNNDGRELDNICLSCLSSEVEGHKKQ